MRFEEIVGQENLKEKIITLAQKKELPHAILILGQDGQGGLPMALALTQYIFCTNPDSYDSCGVCNSCKKIASLQHPDLHFSFPFASEAKKTNCDAFFHEFRQFTLTHPYGNIIDLSELIGTSKQLNINVEECHNILRKLQIRSYEGGPKVIIIWMPEYLGKEGNTLLKFIEEPTPNTIIIFVSENKDKIISTILSRTQLFSLNRLNNQQIQHALEKNGVDTDVAYRIARISEGNYRKAIELSNGNENNYLQLTKDWLNCIYQNNGLELIKWIDKSSSLPKDISKNFLAYILQLLENTIRLRQIGSTYIDMPAEDLKIVQLLITKGLSDIQISKISEEVNQAIYYIERNANQKILLHSLSLQIQDIIHKRVVMHF